MKINYKFIVIFFFIASCNSNDVEKVYSGDNGELVMETKWTDKKELKGNRKYFYPSGKVSDEGEIVNGVEEGT